MEEYNNKKIFYYESIEKLKADFLKVLVEESEWALLLLTQEEISNNVLKDLADHCIDKKLSFFCSYGPKDTGSENIFDLAYINKLNNNKFKEEEYYLMTTSSKNLENALYRVLNTSFSLNNKANNIVVILNLNPAISLSTIKSSIKLIS